ncbi:MAG: adenosylmethionine--8-amino-7-oxononanoate transaminase [Candidatus Omnitrophica bacterium]|nr:adenosylmethionine--8-amino-7-oxononanoate transaminase [Candidatus Omnitrophota bacterium]
MTVNTWIKKDLRYLWHPYTQMKDCRGTPPILIERAKGMKLYDSDGNHYFDTISSWWCNIHGHNRPEINRAIREQLKLFEHVMFAGFTHRNAITLAERLVSIAPESLSRVFFSDNGSTAVETALKMSFQYWRNIGKRGKKSFVHLDYAYHGDTLGAMSVGGVDLFGGLFKPLFFHSFKVPTPYCYRCPAGKYRYPACRLECVKPLEKTLEDNHGRIAAMIIEPLVLAAGGMIIYPAEYLKKARELTDRYGVHLIVDEVATGFGRTGRMFASEHARIEPDFLCLSKGITSGYLPLGATLTTEKVYRAFYDDYFKKKTFYHGHTYTANPISCSAAIASLDIFEKEKALKRAGKVMAYFHKRLEDFRGIDIVGDVRYIGMIGALELVKDRSTKRPFGLKERKGMEVYREALKRGLLLRPLGNIIYFYLPLCAEKNELEYILDQTYDIIWNSTK